MAVTSTSGSELDLPDQKSKIGNGDNKEEKTGKTCHQCRQKIKDVNASCKNQKKDRTCPIKFCHKCLMNRYGEKAEEMSVLKDWNCPKCRGICNCSVCMKRRGHRPTGILVHTAKATGFSSVSELLLVKGSEVIGIGDSAKESSVALTSMPGKENSFSADTRLKLHPVPLSSSLDEKKPKKIKRSKLVDVPDGDQRDEVLGKQDNGDLLIPTNPVKPQTSNGIYKKEVKNIEKVAGEKRKKQRDKRSVLELQNANVATEIPLPQGSELTTVAGIDLPPEDVGYALQFLEFCAAFKEILDLKEGEPEYILLELIRGGSGCRGKYSLVIRFHIFLLSLIQKDLGEESLVMTYKSGKSSWLHALQSCMSRSRGLSDKLKLDDFGSEADEYESLGPSNRLSLLIFLCDEVLCTAKLRNLIDDQNLKFLENVKVAKERVHAAKQKENQLKQKMHDEVAKAIIAKNGAHLSISEHEAVVSQIQSEAAQAHAEMLEAKTMVPNERSCDAARSEPLLLDTNGRIYWRLKGYSGDTDVLLQDVASWDAVVSSEKWFSFDAEQVKKIDEHILALRKR